MLIATLDWLKLTAIRDQLDTLLVEAARSKMTLREAPVSREIARRDERRISMSSKIAQLPFVRELDGFHSLPSRRWISGRLQSCHLPLDRHASVPRAARHRQDASGRALGR